MNEVNKIIAHVDGACRGNGDKLSIGGWAFVIQFDNNKKEIHSAGYCKNTTNQRMELIALIKVLEAIRIRWPNNDKHIIIFSDSQYVVKGATNWMFAWKSKGWKRTNGISKYGKESKSSTIANLDLWKKISELVNEIHPTIQWVKGHAGNKYNELCDFLASAAIDVQSDYYKIIRLSTIQNKIE